MISNGLELRYRFNGRLASKVTYWNAVRLVNDAEDRHAEFLGAGWSARVAAAS
jgi:hypothetical protein